MREQTGASVSASAGDDISGGALFIITLNSSTTPMALDVPSLAELAGLAVFRSRKVEDGRDRFRLHLGYFESAAAAENVLPVVREHFPAAWIGPAPSSGMGSLDDTSVAQFKFIKAPNTLKSDGGTSTRLRALTAASAPAAPVVSAAIPRMSLSTSPVPAARPVTTPPRLQTKVAGVAKAATSPRAPVSRQMTARPAAPARSAASKPAPAARTAAPARPAAAKAAVSARPAAPKAKAPVRLPLKAALSPNAVSALAPKEVLNLLEGRPSPQHSSVQEQMQPRERAAVIGAIQRFAVQLIWSTDPLNLASVPKLAIFDAYTLYKVQVDRAGRRWYGLRLGFFGDAVSARQVALYARSDFSAAAVVPVSDRECDRAGQAAVKDLPEAERIPKAEIEMDLIDMPRAAPKVDIGLDGPKAPRPAVVAPLRRPEPVTPKPADRAEPAQTPKASAPAAQKAEADRSEKTRRMKSAAEMAADLEAEEDQEFELGGDADALNDTGVRHLAITVVGKKKAGIGKLFKRGRR